MCIITLGETCNRYNIRPSGEALGAAISGGMIWADEEAPSLDQFEALARECFARLPGEFRQLVADVLMRIEDFPSEAVCADMGIESPFELTGLYQGIDLTHKSFGNIAKEPDMIFLYRRPILDEWADGGVTLRELITHILVHEIGHHFGLTDEAMQETLESERE